jgi:hypothetical protein
MRRALFAISLVVVSGCATSLTPARVSSSFQQVFTGLYVRQQGLLGRAAVKASALQVQSACQRTSGAPKGPGEDWVCAVQYEDLDTSTTQTFELQLKADGCWRADGAPATQPSTLVDPVSRRVLTNPLAEFDGCLDTSWHR